MRRWPGRPGMTSCHGSTGERARRCYGHHRPASQDSTPSDGWGGGVSLEVAQVVLVLCRFRWTLQRTLQYAEPELLECPAVMLLVVASNNEVRGALSSRERSQEVVVSPPTPDPRKFLPFLLLLVLAVVVLPALRVCASPRSSASRSCR